MDSILDFNGDGSGSGITLEAASNDIWRVKVPYSVLPLGYCIDNLSAKWYAINERNGNCETEPVIEVMSAGSIVGSYAEKHPNFSFSLYESREQGDVYISVDGLFSIGYKTGTGSIKNALIEEDSVVSVMEEKGRYTVFLDSNFDDAIVGYKGNAFYAHETVAKKHCATHFTLQLCFPEEGCYRLGFSVNGRTDPSTELDEVLLIGNEFRVVNNTNWAMVQYSNNDRSDYQSHRIPIYGGRRRMVTEESKRVKSSGHIVRDSYITREAISFNTGYVSLDMALWLNSVLKKESLFVNNRMAYFEGDLNMTGVGTSEYGKCSGEFTYQATHVKKKCQLSYNSLRYGSISILADWWPNVSIGVVGGNISEPSLYNLSQAKKIEIQEGEYDIIIHNFELSSVIVNGVAIGAMSSYETQITITPCEISVMEVKRSCEC